MAMDMNVALKITAGVTGQQAVDQLRTSMDRLNGAASSVSRGFQLASTAVGAFIGLQAVQSLVGMGRAVIDAADQLDEMAERTGMSVETLSQLQFAAQMTGTSIDQVEGALGKLSAKAVDAASGNKQAALAFEALGVSVRNSDGSMRSSLDIMAEVGDALSEITDATLRTAVAREVFGKSGDAILPFVMRMRELRGEASALGITMSTEFAGQAAKFNDNLDILNAQLSGMGRTILAELLPGMIALSQSWIDAGRNGGTLQVVSEAVAVAFETIVVLAGNVVYVFKQIGAEAVGIGQQLKALANFDFDAFNQIGERMKADAAQARQEIDAWSESILNARKKVQGATTAPAMDGSNAANNRALDVLNRLQAANRQVSDSEKQRAQMLQQLADEVDGMVKGEDELYLAKLRRLGATDKEIAQAQQQLSQRAQLRAADRELEEATKTQMKLEEDARRNKERLADAGKKVFEETRTPAERLNAELVRLNGLLEQGVIDWDTYSRAVFNAQDEFDKVGEKGKDTMSDLKSAIEGWGRQATDTFVEFAFTGKASFKDMVNSILQDIARMLIQKAVMQPIMNAVGGYFGFANGGVMTDSGPLPLKTYATGGIANTPQVALFGEGRMPEAYVPLPDGRTIPVTMSGDAGGTQVVINNYSGAQASAEETTDSRGNRRIEVTIGEMVATEVRRPGSAAYMAMRDTFGSKPALVGR